MPDLLEIALVDDGRAGDETPRAPYRSSGRISSICCSLKTPRLGSGGPGAAGEPGRA